MTRTYARVLSEGRALFGEISGGAFQPLNVDHYGGVPLTAAAIPMSGVELLPPVAPSKVVAVALNYQAHAKEMLKPTPSEPMFFLKPTTAILASGHPIVIPPESAEVHHEGEMGVVVGKTLHRASPEEAREAIFGATCVNDVTARDIQRRQSHYTRAKGYDTFCPVGPVIVAGLDIARLRIRTRVNGETRQDGITGDMIFDPGVLLSFISKVMTLLPGDLVSTGTPPGVGPIRAGEVVEVEIDGIGILRNPVVSAP